MSHWFSINHLSEGEIAIKHEDDCKQLKPSYCAETEAINIKLQ